MTDTITMYALLENGRVIGVFAEEEQARSVQPGEVIPIDVRKPVDVPEPIETVVMARGVRRSLSMKDGIPEVEAVDLGPSWGTTTASAIDGLSPVRTGVEVTRCETYPVGRLQHERLSPAAAEALDALTDMLVETGTRRAKGPGHFCGASLRHISRKVEEELRRSFTPVELQILSVLLELREDEHFRLLIDCGAISGAECSALQERLMDMVPVMRPTMARFTPDMLD